MIMTQTIYGWFSLLSFIGVDFTATISGGKSSKILADILMSLLYMCHLTLLYCYMSAPIAWLLNPSVFNFTEVILASLFLATLTGVALSIASPQIETKRLFKNHSSKLAILRMSLAIIVPIVLLYFLYLVFAILD